MTASRSQFLARPDAILATSNTASESYGAAGQHPVQPKTLFFAKFRRSASSGASLGDLAFVVKQTDRPSVQPTVEELNQYNKKRVIVTSVKYTPVNMTLYDTVDGAALRFLNAYSAYHFGDFGQTSDKSWRDDVLSDKINDSGTGFGMRMLDDGLSGSDGTNGQFFIDAIEINRMYADHYQRWTLVNPRIVSYEPDELDYDASGISTIRMTIQYEAVLLANEGIPQPIAGDNDLMSIFGIDGLYTGQVVDNSATLPGYTFSGGSTGGMGGSPFDTSSLFGGNLDQGNNLFRTLLPSNFSNSVSGFSNLDFGDISHTISSANSILRTGLNLSSIARGNSGLASILGIGQSLGAGTSISKQLRQVSGFIGAIDTAAHSVLSLGGSATSGIFGGGLLNSVTNTAAMNGSSPRDLITSGSNGIRGVSSDFISNFGVSGTTAGDDVGISLTPDVLTDFNNNSDGSVQLGRNLVQI